MITEITKNPRRELKGVIDSILNLATTEEKNQHLWNVLHFLHQDMLTLTRHNEKKKGVSGDMVGLPTNASGNKKSNKRMKRAHER